MASRQTNNKQHQQLRQSVITTRDGEEIFKIFGIKNEQEASNEPSENVINPIENGTNLGNENTSLTNHPQHTKVNKAVKNDDKPELMQTRLSEIPDIRHTWHFDNTSHENKTFDQIQHLNVLSSLDLNVPGSSSEETANRSEPSVQPHEVLDHKHDNIATSYQKTKEAYQSTTREAIMKTRNLFVTEITAKQKAGSAPFSVKNRSQVRHFFRESGNFPDMFYFINNKCKEKEFVILCDTTKYFVLISLLIFAIVILPLMFLSACLILSYKFRILKRIIFHSVRLLRKAFNKNSKRNDNHYSMELPYYAKKVQSGEKKYESKEPFI